MAKRNEKGVLGIRVKGVNDMENNLSTVMCWINKGFDERLKDLKELFLKAPIEGFESGCAFDFNQRREEIEFLRAMVNNQFYRLLMLTGNNEAVSVRVNCKKSCVHGKHGISYGKLNDGIKHIPGIEIKYNIVGIGDEMYLFTDEEIEII